MICCSKDSRYFCSSPSRELEDDVLMNLKLYNSELHKAAFCLPNFAKRAIFDQSSSNKEQDGQNQQQRPPAVPSSSTGLRVSSPDSPSSPLAPVLAL